MRSNKGFPFWQALLFLLPSLIYSPSLKAEITKGFYVNDFKEIIGQEEKEDELLSFAQSHGFNYLLLYNLHYIHHNLYDLTDPTTSIVLANFIKKAKTKYGIKEVGMVGEKAASFEWIEDYQDDYDHHKSFRIDVYNLEFEFWNSNLVENYYCSTYLEEENLECSTDGAFEFYLEELEKIKILTESREIKCETYIGNTTATQCESIGAICDRVLVHYYRKSDTYNNGNSIYQYKDYRIEALAPSNGTIAIIPLFSATKEYMGSWLGKNPKEKALNTYLSGVKGYNSQQGDWKNHVLIEGYHWYRYSDLLKNLVQKTDFANFSVSTNQTQKQQEASSGFSLIRTISINVPAASSTPVLEINIFPNPAYESIHLDSEGEEIILVEIFTIEGKLYKTLSGKELLEQKIDSSAWPAGQYVLRSYSNFDQETQTVMVKHD